MIHIVPHAYHVHVSGKKASIYGASPWVSEVEKPEWNIVYEGWTWYDDFTNTYGLGRQPVETREEAKAVADEINARLKAAYEKSVEIKTVLNTKIVWEKTLNGYDSEFGYSIFKVGKMFYTARKGDATDYPIYKSLAKAKEWCEACIRSERKNEFYKDQ